MQEFEKTANQPENDAVILEWRNHPAREHPILGVLLFFFIGACGVTAIAFTGYFLMGLLALLVLLGAFSGFLFPMHYRITRNEVRVNTMFGNNKRNLKNYRRVIKEKRGALLSPFSRRHPLDAIRGFYIRKENNPEELWLVLDNIMTGENGRTADNNNG